MTKSCSKLQNSESQAPGNKSISMQLDMTPTKCEAYRKLQEEIKRCKSQGKSQQCNGKIIQYVSKKFRTCILINNTPTPVENNDFPAAPVVAESNDPGADGQNDVPIHECYTEPVV